MKWQVRIRRDRDDRPSKFREFECVDLEGEDFSGLRLDEFCAEASRFTRCRFERMVVASAVFGSPHSGKDCLYLDCSFDGSQSDKKLRKSMNREAGHNVLKHMTGSRSTRNPRGFEWHHPKDRPLSGIIPRTDPVNQLSPVVWCRS